MPGSREINVEWKNLDRLYRLIASTGSEVLPAMARALHEEAQAIFVRSQQQVPFDEGVLHGSGQIHPPSVSGSNVVVEITYGGNAMDYAAEQHENRTYRHDEGRKSHYLEDPFNDRLPSLQSNVTDRIEAILKGLI